MRAIDRHPARRVAALASVLGFMACCGRYGLRRILRRLLRRRRDPGRERRLRPRVREWGRFQHGWCFDLCG
jgi:hypothetical protein